MDKAVKNRAVLFEKLSKEAGSILLENFGRKLNSVDKGDFNEQAELDLIIEKLLLDSIKNHTDDSIYSEEEGFHKGDQNLWIIDPLDGTSNFLASIPIFAIAATLIKSQTPQFSSLYFPIVNKLVQAFRGQGVEVNGKKITSKKQEDTDQISLIGGYKTQKKQGRVRGKLKERYKRVLSLWCPSWDGLLLTEGKTDALVAIENETEDLMPIITIAREMGFVIKTFDGKDFQFRKLTPLLPSLVIAKDEESIEKILTSIS